MMPSHPAALIAGWLALALGGGLLPGARERQLAAPGLLTIGLALAAWRAGSPPGQALTSPDELGEGFLVINGGLLLLGAFLVIAAAAVATPGLLRAPARFATGLGAVLLWQPCAGFMSAAGPLRALGAAVAVGIGAVGLVASGRALASTPILRDVAGLIFPAPLAPMRLPFASIGLPGVLVAAIAAVALGPHVAVVFLGVIAGAWAAYLMVQPRAARPLPLAPVLTLLLVPAYWLLATIAGPVGLGRLALREVPVSPAAELAVAPLLLLGAWATAALWPLHRQLPGAMAAPLGGLLLAGIALPLTPGGLEYWRPLVVPLLVLGLWHAAAHARWPLLAGGAGVLGAAGAAVAGASGAVWLLATGLGLELAALRPLPMRLTTMLIRPAAWLAASWGGLQVVEGGLQGEVVYTALGTLGLALILGARVRAHRPRDEASTPDAR